MNFNQQYSMYKQEDEYAPKKLQNSFEPKQDGAPKTEGLSTSDKLAYMQAVKQIAPTNAAGGTVNQPSVGGAASDGLQAGLTTGIMTGNPYAGLAVGGLVATGSYMQASANADEARRQAAARIAAQAHADQAKLTQDRGQAYSDYAIRMAQLAERL